MTGSSLENNLHDYARWREKLVESIRLYQQWRKQNGYSDVNSTNTLASIVQGLVADRVTLAFVAEFSRGKSELINALFFGETGVRLLPSTPGRTTMCPTELFYDEHEGSYIRLLDIDSRLEDTPFSTLRHEQERWKHIALNYESPGQMQEAFRELVAVKQVSKNEAIELGLFDVREAEEGGVPDPESVEIPRWRHALISFPHPLLKEGLTILDTPGLNALGSEPELTLNMLPSAQAIIFVIAADTGVTQSDMVMWRNHIKKVMKTGNQGLAIVLNKIDTMWDHLDSAGGFQDDLDSQVQITAKTLGINQDFIFPVSAKQALIAKIKGDKGLLNRSCIADIEAYLSKDIIQQRQKILMNVVAKDIGFLINQSLKQTESLYSESSKQLQKYKQLDFTNREMLAKLTADIKNRQETYSANIADFKKRRQAFFKQHKALVKKLSPKRIDMLIRFSKLEMGKSMTTVGMKKSIKRLFDDFRSVLQDCVESTKVTQDLVKSIHQQFYEDYRFQEVAPQMFSIASYQAELEQLFDEGETYRLSTGIVLTEQSIVVRKLYSTLIFKARVILYDAYKDAYKWGDNAMLPLMHQIIAYKKQIDGRLKVLDSSIQSKYKIQENLDNLEHELQLILEQRNKLNTIVKAIEGESAVFTKGASFLMDDMASA